MDRLLHSESELESLAASIAAQEATGLVIFLRGPLGAGKTTFARGFLRGMGHDGVVKSPTYTLVEPYCLNGTPCYHFDLYRLADPEELEFTGARDYFNDESICLIEWPEKATGMLPSADLDCSLSHHEAGRSITLTACSAKGDAIMLQAFSDQSL